MYDKISTNRVKKYNTNYYSQVDFQQDPNLLEQEYKKLNKDMTVDKNNYNSEGENYNNLLGHYFREKGIFERDINNTTSK